MKLPAKVLYKSKAIPMRTQLKTILSVAFVALFLYGCAEVELASHVAKKHVPIAQNSGAKGYFKVGNSYKVRGQRYYPKETYSFTQTGIASWYGPNFHGKKTANGETFDMYDLTAAHKTLQMPSIVRVTNLENGKSIIARVNDRGPFSKSRVIDMSKRSAQALGFEHQGTAKVKIQVLSEESRQVAQLAKNGQSTRGFEIALNEGRSPVAISPMRPQVPSARPMINKPLTTQLASAAPNNIYVQAGAFSNQNSAQEMANALRSFGEAHVQPRVVNGRSLYRVRFGPMQDPQSANVLLSQLDGAGRSGAIVVID
jgi:rare lipoprotein A